MITATLIFQLCLPSDGQVECIFKKEEIKSYSLCEQRAEELQDEFFDLAQMINIQCRVDSYDV